MANSDWSFGDYLRKPSTPSDRAVPQEPRSDRIPQPGKAEPESGWDALRELFEQKHGAGYDAAVFPDGDTVVFDPAGELVAEGLVELFVAECDVICDCSVCFNQHFRKGETCRKHQYV